MSRNKMSKALLYLALTVALILPTACSSGNTDEASPTVSNKQNEKATESSKPTEGANTAESALPADPMGKYDPPIEISTLSSLDSDVKFPEGESPENNIWTKTYEEQLGIKIKIKWTGPSEQAAQKVNLMIVSEELPNILSVNDNQFQQLYDAGMLEDLTDAYEKYATPFLKEQLTYDGGRAMKSATRDGKLYSIPTFLDPLDDTAMLWVRTDWLKKLNLPEPKTMADFEKIAEAFTTQDPDGDKKNNTPGFTVTSDITYHLSPFFNGYHAYPAFQQQMGYPVKWLKDSSGQLVTGLFQPEMTTALQKLQDFYKKGWIDKQYAAQDYDTLTKAIANGKVGMLFGVWWYPSWPLQESVNKDPNADWKAYPIPSVDGTPAKTSATGLWLRNHNVVIKGYKNPEALIKLANLTLEKSFGKTAEPEVYLNKADPTKGNAMWKYSAVWVELGHKNLLKFQKVKNALETKNSDGLNVDEMNTYNNVLKYESGDATHWNYEKLYGIDGSWNVTIDNEKNDLFQYDEFTGSPTKTMVEKGPIIMKKLNETVNRIIMGASINEWDKFQDYWKSNGGDEITKEVNEWYKLQNK
ncbi:type 2 periplasmic-binding domain-containing protein [Cohnella abietis]|uniref:Lipoprotein LipO n=1 Tax=Cohnella abietis TaxID=2507935 RepID=A0A3T1D3S6_9BACL|nr:extracellular solute-binding protein [Cohnella abietis]BBI32770.1 lipoprotein LipO [Cohnella abietis]